MTGVRQRYFFIVVTVLLVNALLSCGAAAFHDAAV